VKNEEDEDLELFLYKVEVMLQFILLKCPTTSEEF